MKRITEKQLQSLVDDLNTLTGNPLKQRENGKSNIGNYHLDYAYGGVKLDQMSNEHGGVRSISTDGFGTKRQLYSFITAFMAGMEKATK